MMIPAIVWITSLNRHTVSAIIPELPRYRRCVFCTGIPLLRGTLKSRELARTNVMAQAHGILRQPWNIVSVFLVFLSCNSFLTSWYLFKSLNVPSGHHFKIHAALKCHQCGLSIDLRRNIRVFLLKIIALRDNHDYLGIY